MTASTAVKPILSSGSSSAPTARARAGTVIGEVLPTATSFLAKRGGSANRIQNRKDVSAEELKELSVPAPNRRYVWLPDVEEVR